MDLKNYYEILHVPNFSDIGVIKESYRKLIKIYHPDVNPNIDPSLISELNNAYEILKDSAKRELYDRRLRDFLLNSRNTREFVAKNAGNQQVFVYENEKQGTFHKKIRTVEEFLNRTILKVYKNPDKRYEQLGDLKDIKLIIAYIESTGLQRDTYIRELLERELLIITDEGKIIPTKHFLDLYSKIDI